MKSGIIVLKKEEGITSQGAVNRVKRLLSAEKAGHTGTLDPLATGVLPILIGRAVKASEYMLSSDKHYRATLRLGITTDTEDITGNILTESCTIPSEETVLRAVSEFVGDIMQIPPMYSALKVNGKKLCADLSSDKADGVVKLFPHVSVLVNAILRAVIVNYARSVAIYAVKLACRGQLGGRKHRKGY